MTKERAIVEQGYDAMADAYLDYMDQRTGDPRLRFLDQLLGRLRSGSQIVDLGCGAGIPCTAKLAEQHNVLGIDISAEQLCRARERIPRARFTKADIAAVDLPPGTLDAVTAFYSLTHIPRVEHAEVFRRIASWMKAGGYLLATLSARGESDGMQDDFVGVPMYFSGYGSDANLRLLDEAGFDIVLNEIVAMNEPGGESSFQWLLARKRN
ncbi:MAG: class I SAM-dependent methyltransferase [Pseudonocardiales bacterium]|nr:MAG: class I SAM-dependent methyltransferase [Pseudonocardiales bacterium]